MSAASHEVSTGRRSDVTNGSQLLPSQALLELRAILENATVGILFSRNRILVQANPQLAQMFGFASVKDVIGQPGLVLYPSQAAYDALGDEAGPLLAAGKPYRGEIEMRRQDGSLFWCRMSAKAINQQRTQDGTIWIMEDVTAQREADRRLREALADQEMIFNNAAVGIMHVRERIVVRANRKLEKIYGYGPGEMLGRSARDFHSSEELFLRLADLAHDTLWRGEAFSTEWPAKRKDGTLFWVRLTGQREPNAGDRFDAVWLFEDITEKRHAEEALAQVHEELERRVLERTSDLSAANTQLQEEIFERMQAEQRVWQMAHHDALTGLPNRALLHDRLGQTLMQAARDRNRVGVMFLDLDRFKNINDTLGHDVGDQLLKAVAERLRGVVRAADTVARLGGDEFVVILHDIADADDAARVADKIIATFVPVVRIDSHELRTSTSIGISIYPEDGSEANALMKNADTAMYHAKRAGRDNFHFFSARMSAETERQFRLEQRLLSALEQGHLSLVYQPQIALFPGKPRTVCGTEALLRWNDPEDGPISPAEFIPIAEESGLILPVGEWVLHNALRQNRRWQDAGYPPLPVAVNLSPRQFCQKGLVDTIRRILAETGQPAHLLELEITETALVQDAEEARARLEELAAMGVRLAIDDFGIGYSSLNYLKRFPVNRLKIDRSFVGDLTTDSEDAAIVAAIIGLARGLDLELVAEGVETAEQLAGLQALGCHCFQGYYFSHPLSPDHEQELFAPSRLS